VNDRQRQILIVNGIGLVIGAMAVGWVFFFFLLREVVLWPVIPPIAVNIAGDDRAWRMAHMEGLMQGLLLLAIGAIGGRLRLSARQAQSLLWTALVTGWLFFLPAAIGPFFGARGLAFGGGPFGASLANDVMYLCGWPPVVCVHVMLALLLLGAVRGLRALPR